VKEPWGEDSLPIREKKHIYLKGLTGQIYNELNRKKNKKKWA
jgi:hypothetical protein